MTRVAELMSSPPISVAPDAPLGEVAALLVARGVHGVVVLDESAVAGVVSDTDLLAGEWLATDPESLETMRTLTARELMTAPAVTIDAEADAVEAATLLRRQRLARLVVTTQESPVGVLATSDLVALLGRGALGRASVGDVTTRAVVVCREETTAAQAARAMNERRSRSLVVVSPQGAPRGVVTGADLLPLVAGGGTDTPVRELMHEPLTIAPEASLREAADRMLKEEVHRLIVVDPEAPDTIPLGLVSTADLVAEMADPGSVWRWPA
jgi:predicted transcriptional regulator